MQGNLTKVLFIMNNIINKDLKIKFKKCLKEIKPKGSIMNIEKLFNVKNDLVKLYIAKLVDVYTEISVNECNSLGLGNEKLFTTIHSKNYIAGQSITEKLFTVSENNFASSTLSSITGISKKDLRNIYSICRKDKNGTLASSFTECIQIVLSNEVIDKVNNYSAEKSNENMQNLASLPFDRQVVILTNLLGINDTDTNSSIENKAKKHGLSKDQIAVLLEAMAKKIESDKPKSTHNMSDEILAEMKSEFVHGTAE
jgi:hypothetical protein